MAVAGAVSRSLSMFSLDRFRNKDFSRLALPGIVSRNTVQAIKYNEALDKIKDLKNKLIGQLNNLSPSECSSGRFFWLELYILAICAQKEMITSINDGFIASDVPWDLGADIPSVSSTIGDAVSYAERLKDPKDHFLKALLLSFSGWTLLSTEKKECACSNGKLQDISVDVLINVALSTKTGEPSGRPIIAFFVGVQSDDPDHLERHYSFKDKSVRNEGLIIIHRSQGRVDTNDADYFNQADQFRVNKMAELLDGLIGSFSKTAQDP